MRQLAAGGNVAWAAGWVLWARVATMHSNEAVLAMMTLSCSAISPMSVPQVRAGSDAGADDGRPGCRPPAHALAAKDSGDTDGLGSPVMLLWLSYDDLISCV